MVMLVKETQTDTTSARPVIVALASECRDRLDIMAAENEAAFVAAVHALHAELGTFVPAGTQQATAGSQPQQSARDEEKGTPCDSDGSQRLEAAEAELCAGQAVCSQSHATRFLFATLALALSDAGSADFCSTVCKQLRLALRRGVPPAIGEALAEVLLTVCSAASSDLSRSCRRILLQAATRKVGLGGFLSSALDRSQGNLQLTPVPYKPEPAAQCKPGLLFAARVDIAGLQSSGVTTHVAVQHSLGGCGRATIFLIVAPHAGGAWSCALYMKLEELPSGCQLPAVVCLAPEGEADTFLDVPISEWETLAARLQDGPADQRAWVVKLSVVDEQVSILMVEQSKRSKEHGAHVLLLHAQRT